MPLASKDTPQSTTHLLRFAATFLVCFVLVSFLWLFVSPIYNRVIVAVTNAVLPLVEHPSMTRVGAEGESVLVYRDEPGAQGGRLFLKFATRYVYLAFVPLLALFLATPKLRVVRRIKLALIGLIILACFHITYLIAAVRLGYIFVGLSKVGRAEYCFCDWMQVLLRILWEVAAVLIWWALTFRYWWKRPLVQSKGSFAKS